MSEYKGQRVEEAIQIGLQTLGLTKDQVKINVIEEEKKGFLGIGRREAVVQLIPIEDNKTSVVSSSPVKECKVLENLPDTQATTELAVYLTNITRDLGAPAMVKVNREKDYLVFHLESEKAGLLIGKHGRVLNAMQYLAQVFVHRVAKNRLSVVVNVGDYRERRQATMEKIAHRTARQVEETGEAVYLEPMPAFERKIIHGILTDHPYVETHSEGDE